MHRASWGTPILIGVGGALDVWSGRARRAPALVQKLGLEWLWRALSDAARFKRLSSLCSFVWLVLSSRLAGRRREADND
jgi:N-acetylglucosaminyldiphosphoundecaprenol N-acetyl-beta-D-mannosaminyltransferase